MMKELSREKLANDMEVIFCDLSRKIAGDRWLVSLKCEASIPIPEEFWQGTADREMQPEIRQALGERLSFSVIKNRYFIDESEKEKVMADSISQIRTNMMAYLENPRFPARLFGREYGLTEKRLRLDQQYRDHLGKHEKDNAAGNAD